MITCAVGGAPDVTSTIWGTMIFSGSHGSVWHPAVTKTTPVA